jgi:hypothetical protein
LETSLSLREDHATAANLVAVAADTPVGRIWIPATQLAAELGVSRRTIGRWLLDVTLGFPRPKIVNHRLYFERSSVEAWKTTTAVKVAHAFRLVGESQETIDRETRELFEALRLPFPREAFGLAFALRELVSRARPEATRHCWRQASFGTGRKFTTSAPSTTLQKKRRHRQRRRATH